VLIVDNIGMLSSLYQYADFAFIGGSFGKGLHNILEAATFGMPIFFGNKAYRQFQEAVDLISLGGAFAVASSDNLAEILEKIRSQKGKKKEIGRISEKYILQNIGATEKVLSVVRAILGDK
jgi:3-deoxy-D-manno-octulosonic-acid transferase